MELTRLTLSEAGALIAARKISPVELVRAHLSRVLALDPLIRSYITLAGDSALEQASRAEQAIARGDYRGPLHGLPLAHKDLIETAALRTTAGSRFLADYLPREDAVAVQRLHAAGAITLGKLNLHEWAMSITTDNPHYGTCKNPWNLQRIPGGSSGGSAAALAAELCLGSLGTDSAGSIRLPAALCGVVGLKPTFGRVSRRGVLPLSWALDHVGPMARRVRDVALLLQAVAGHDPDDPYSADAPVEDYLARLEEGVRGRRVALAFGHFFPPNREPSEEVLQAVEGAARRFERLGATVREVAWPDGWEQSLAALTLINGDAALVHQERVEARPTDFGSDILADLQRAARTSGVEVARARHLQATLRHRARDFFEEYDLLLTPAVPVPAPPHDEPREQRRRRPSLICYTAPFNLVGLPALALPCGFTSSGLPIGLQIVGRPWGEAELLQAGHAYEQATEWHLHRPSLPLPASQREESE